MFAHRISDEAELRILEMRHADAVYKVVDRNRNYLSKWLPWVSKTRAVEDTEKFIKSELNSFSKNLGFTSGIFYKNEFIGCISIQGINQEHKKASIGYWLAEDYQGLGIMTAACREMIHYAVDELGLNRIEIRAATENVKSRAIPERLLFKNEGTLRQEERVGDVFLDHVVYGMLASEWKGQKS